MSGASPTPSLVPDSWARMIWILVDTPDDPKSPAIAKLMHLILYEIIFPVESTCTLPTYRYLTRSHDEKSHQRQHSGYAPHPLHNLKAFFVQVYLMFHRDLMTTFPGTRILNFQLNMLTRKVECFRVP